MPKEREIQPLLEGIRDVIAIAGGRLVGRTRLQKTMYILKEAGLGPDLGFEYKHYGPYSDLLASLSNLAGMTGLIRESEERSSWGGTYSVYSCDSHKSSQKDGARGKLIKLAAQANPIELELAATALFLHYEGFPDPWQETAERKPDKIEDGRLQRARALYQRLQAVKTPAELPRL